MVKGDRPKTNSRANKKKTMKTKNQNLKGLQSRSEQLSKEKTPAGGALLPIDFERRFANRRLSTERLLALLRNDAPRFFELAEVVGKWVWVQFTDKQPREVTALLAELGFHWNNKRRVWQHPCGMYRDVAAVRDPRTKYRSYFIADAQTT
ncbi:MAG TPA: hypothetical protein VFW05_00215 [Verrucomicrobiae bacterium]|nr:hypothetical protein [Verrucomicrobiae bacterium]